MGLAEAATDLFESIEKAPQQGLIDWFTNKLGDRDAAYRQVLQGAMKLCQDYFDEQDLPPAERKARALEAKLKEREDELARVQGAREEAEREEAEFNAAQSLAKELKPALEAAGLPIKPGIIQAVAEVLHATREEGFPVTAAHACKLVKAELEQKSLEGLKALSIDDLLRLRPDAEDAIAQRRIGQVVEKRNLQRVPKSNGTTPPKAGEAPKRRTYGDIQELLER